MECCGEQTLREWIDDPKRRSPIGAQIKYVAAAAVVVVMPQLCVSCTCLSGHRLLILTCSYFDLTVISASAVADALALFRQLVTAIQHIHGCGILHRKSHQLDLDFACVAVVRSHSSSTRYSGDIKPGNVFLQCRVGATGSFELRLGDFGLAARLPQSATSAELSATATVNDLGDSMDARSDLEVEGLTCELGTPSYAAPEQLLQSSNSTSRDLNVDCLKKRVCMNNSAC